MNQLIDVGIGLALVFALVALICTGLQEMLAAVLNLRGKTLWEGVQSMLQANAPANAKAASKGNAAPDGPVSSPRDANAAGANAEALKPATGAEAAAATSQSPGLILEAALRVHPLIVTLIPDRFGLRGFFQWMRGGRVPSADVGQAKPSYLEASTFATVLADKIGETWRGGRRRFDDFPLAVAAMPEGQLKHVLQGMVRDTQGDPARLRHAVEAWYDETMVRVGGWYKRRIQLLLLLLGALVAGALNVDAIYVARSLAANPALTARVADRAASIATAYQAAEGQAPAGKSAQAPAGQAPASDDAKAAKDRAEKARQELQDLNLPIGWGGGRPIVNAWDFLLMLAGWCITALAASFGAPFWFDLISKVAPLRSSGAKPATAPPSPEARTWGAAAATTIAPPAGTAPFRAALNDFEATGISEAEILQLKRTLGVEGPSASTPMLDQVTRNKIRERQQAQAWPPTGELSANWMAQLLTGAA